MANKIDITQTNPQLSNYITDWSGSSLTGPSQSVAIYNSQGTASIAQAPADEYYLVRRAGSIQWAPIVAGATTIFSLSAFDENVFYEDDFILSDQEPLLIGNESYISETVSFGGYKPLPESLFLFDKVYEVMVFPEITKINETVTSYVSPTLEV
jgi:hypothetical protein